MSVDDFLGILIAQGRQCAICRHSLTRPVIDHDHTTGRVRGLVCFRCNSWLAAIENVKFVTAAHRYLREHVMLPPTHEFYKNRRHFEQLRRNKAKQTAKRKAHPRLAAIHDRIHQLVSGKHIVAPPPPTGFLKGEQHPQARLTDEQVRVIRQSPEMTSVLSRRFGVSKATIRRVRRRTYWKHVA